MQVESFLENTARAFPEKTALVCEGRRLTYRWIEEESNRIAHGLLGLGVQRGDRVAVHLENSVEAVLSVFAIVKAGAIFVLINPAVKSEKLVYMLNNSGTKVLITKDRRGTDRSSYLERTPQLESVVIVGTPPRSNRGGEHSGKNLLSYEDLMASHSESVLPPVKRSIDIDIAALIYTSGSTGNPKGVILTHLNMVSAATSVIEYLDNTSDDVILNVLPLSFSYGLYQVLMAFKVGATVVLERSFAYPHATIELLMQERVTGLAIVPTISAVLLQMDISQYELPHLRYITNAGAALPSAHVSQLRKLFPNTKLYLMYGLTECKRVAYLPPDQLDSRPMSVGKAMPNVEAYIVDDAGKRLPPGEVGELVVRGSNVMSGYWNLPEETDKVLKPGEVPYQQVLHTGDLFRMDDEGYLYWVGRRDDIIKTRGEKVSPREVENVLYKLEAVSSAVVIGVPDPVLGQIVKAVVTLKDGATLHEKDILRHCARHLEEFMVPKIVEFRNSMPKTAAGKIDKRALVAGGEN